jgi:hypothetical protein
MTFFIFIVEAQLIFIEDNDNASRTQYKIKNDFFYFYC